MGLMRHLCVTYTVLLALKHTEQVDENTNDEFNRLAQEQHSVCSTYYSCLEQNITESFVVHARVTPTVLNMVPVV